MPGTRPRTGARSLSLIALTLAVGTAVSGCTREPEVYARLDDSNVVFLACEVQEADSILVEIAPRGSIDYSPAWSTTGDLEIAPTVIRYGLAPVGWQNSQADSFVPSEMAISLTYGRAPLVTGGDVTSVVFPGWKLGDAWINPKGEVVDASC